MRTKYAYLEVISQEEVILLDIKCKDCGKLLDLSNWSLGNRRQYKKYCLLCSNIRSNTWKKQNKEKVNLTKKKWASENKDKILNYKAKVSSENKRKYQLKQAYGLSWDDFIQLVSKADSKCQICYIPLYLNTKDKLQMICVDHCHTTGKVRGILCNSCNRAIGFLNDSIENMENMIKYLKG